MSTHRVVAFSSLLAFVTQVVFALLMLRLFSPQAVGQFSVISQIGFFWMTLALAQAPLSLLANQYLPTSLAAQQAWRASVWRGMGLLPLAVLAIWFSQLTVWSTLLWALLLAFCQMSWMLSQSFTLRQGTAWQQAAVRVVPPVIATATALTVTWLGPSVNGLVPTLVLSALLGYAVGAAWLIPALRKQTHLATAARHEQTNNPPLTATQSDTRSATLRMAHTLVDVLLATVIIVVWQRLYGAEETGWMSALLRVLGFVPAIVHMAWAQVTLAKGHQPSKPLSIWVNPWWLGISAFAGVIALGLSCAAALHLGWLAPSWDGVAAYIPSLVLWQGCACLSAAFSHRPFQTQAARTYSWVCMALGIFQLLVLLAPMAFTHPIGAIQHMMMFALVSSLGLFGLTVWMARLR